MISLPFDIPTYIFHNSKESFQWPTAYNNYSFLSRSFIDKSLEILEVQKGDMRICLSCKLSDILVDLANATRQNIDLQVAKTNGYHFLYDENFSPVIDWFLNGKSYSDARIVHRLSNNIREESIRTKIILYARWLKRLLKKNRNKENYNSMHFNILMSEWIAEKGVPTFDILPEIYLHGPLIDLGNKANAIVAAFCDLVIDSYDFCKSRRAGLIIAVEMIVKFHLRQALSDLKFLKKSNLYKILGNGLISGTPKYQGRMLGWYFLEHSKDVIRFAHGGERVFYKDYVWPISELPYCSHYFAHSQVEAQNIKKRVHNGDYGIIQGMENIAFCSQGSRKHQELFGSSNLPFSNKTIVYVASCYEHDQAPGFPSFKVPDVLYFDFQIRLLKLLRSQGWYIILKPHPKGLYLEKDYLEGYVDEIAKTPFVPDSFKADRFLFDFAGTAFFDTLATRQRITLLNLGGRPFDLKECNQLQKRCSILNLGFDSLGRINIDGAAILETLNNAPTNICTQFIKRYAF